MMAAAALAGVGAVMQAAAEGEFGVMYVGRFVAGVGELFFFFFFFGRWGREGEGGRQYADIFPPFFLEKKTGVGAASMITPLYTSENAPRAIRGALTGMYQFFIVTGVCIAFWINYGSLLHFSGTVQYVVPLALQALPAIVLLVGMFISSETPRWLARQDRWDEAARVLSRVRNLPQTHPYVQDELQEMADQLAWERRLIAGSGVADLLKEMVMVPGNRKRALISIGLMICQQMTGEFFFFFFFSFPLKLPARKREEEEGKRKKKKKKKLNPPSS